MAQSIFHTPVVDLIPKGQKVITISAKDTLPTAFKTLANNNIYGAPVVDPNTQEYYGFLDMVDIVTFIVHILCEDPVQGKHQKYHNIEDEDFYRLLEQVEKFDLERVVNVVDLSKRNPMIPLKKNAPVLDAINIFAKTRVHRIPLVEGNQVVNILTQSAVIDWLAHHIKVLDPISHKTVKELQIGYKEVIHVSPESRALEAFRMMVDHKVSSVAVVDQDGTLFTNLSAKDIKLVQPEALFTKMYKTTLEFIQAVRAKRLDTFAASIHCKESSTLKEIIERLAAAKIHRLYIVDDDHKPIGVLSLVDVMGAIIKELNL
mmetsp:Transcript_14080/g.19592  ORF Transcript_14080/g.19592 Transcript_14080/m.19592 type:complete len:317 (-) Transcript_14080:111-1061(-)